MLTFLSSGTMNFLKGNVDKRNPRSAGFFLMFAMSIWLFHGCSKEPVDPPGTMSDIDGNVYRTITISGQTWMEENLRVAHYSDGTQIPGISDNRVGSDESGMCCDYKFIADKKRGKLYSWYAVEETRAAQSGPGGLAHSHGR